MPEIVPGEPLISFLDVRVDLGGEEVLRGVSFDVWPGESKILVGETGSGKTVLLKLAAGLLRADSGRIYVMGHNLTEMREEDLLEFRRNVGFVFQEGALFDSETVGDNVAFQLREEGVPEVEIGKRVREALTFVEMEQAIEKYPAELSGGMRRRVSIARAVVSGPPIVLFDSPTGGLDPVTSQTIIMLILRMRDAHRVTSMIATHRLQDAFGLAHYRFDPASEQVAPAGGNGGDREENPVPPTNILVLRNGVVYFEGDTEALHESPDPYLKGFLASVE